jgi:fructose-1,6-bisphosphatase/inositol monophosphatase family enzyme
LTLQTGFAYAFRFGSDITGLTATASGKTDYIGAVFNLTDQRWDVVAVTKGF